MKRRILACAITAMAMVVALSVPADAATSLAQIQAKVSALQDEATSAAEGVQEAKVRLATLTRTLNGIKAKAAVQGQTLSKLQKSLQSIAIEQYKAGGLGQSLELLFSSDPALYLSSAGALDALSRRKSAQLRKYEAAQQRLDATTMTVNDKLALVAATEKKLKAQSAIAKAKLAQAEAILSKLTKAERERLAKLASDKENADQASSQALAKKVSKFSGRGGVALKFALAQLGDRYVFGAAGMVTWDCSGLTMRAFKVAGVSLPHSAAAQAQLGKPIQFKYLRPGDLLFYGRPISHVSIYLGGGKMVHAPRTGSRVKIAGLSLGSKPYVGARRY